MKNDKPESKPEESAGKIPLKRLVMPINSRWVVEKGRWEKNKNEFVDRKNEAFTRIIKMEIEERSTGKVLRFIGGPTGHETYYVDDLLRGNSTVRELCICGGTINRWPACYVDKQTVLRFIKV